MPNLPSPWVNTSTRPGAGIGAGADTGPDTGAGACPGAGWAPAATPAIKLNSMASATLYFIQNSHVPHRPILPDALPALPRP
ncbi:MAG: hypothetical protein EP335_00455 [Alphaproteobacteria bacterium]|nr:MAG: hypothetical protein EP335_00455 [Alphaproteobacteria bacterium]